MGITKAIVVIEVPAAKNGIISLGKFKNSNRKIYAGTRTMPDPIPKKPESSPAKIPRNKKLWLFQSLHALSMIGVL